ncbi:hypothetical protein BKA81DRAFT_399769 [Phyllosticta paracitricarpa]|uniref:Uncharacterized protein n=1 Tax=Phyllosticta citricarpa TaxID=55181 RepID=A0ABR1MNG8_9PEZI
MVRGALLASLPQEQPFCTSQSASRARPPLAYQSAHRPPPPPKQSHRGCSTDCYPRPSCRRRASTLTRRRRIQPRTTSTTHHCFLASAPSCRNADDDQVSMRTTDATRNAPTPWPSNILKIFLVEAVIVGLWRGGGGGTRTTATVGLGRLPDAAIPATARDSGGRQGRGLMNGTLPSGWVPLGCAIPVAALAPPRRTFPTVPIHFLYFLPLS